MTETRADPVSRVTAYISGALAVFGLRHPSSALHVAMASLDYAEIFPYTNRIQSQVSVSTNNSRLKPAPKVLRSLPHPEKHVAATSTSTSTTYIIFISNQRRVQHSPSIAALFYSTLQAGSNISHSRPEESELLSTRDLLSMPTTAVNLRRFVAKTGPLN